MNKTNLYNTLEVLKESIEDFKKGQLTPKELKIIMEGAKKMLVKAHVFL